MSNKTLTQLAVDALPAMRHVDAFTSTDKAEDLLTLLIAIDIKSRIEKGEDREEVMANILKELQPQEEE